MLAVTHRALWDEAFDEESPRLGDNLADASVWVHSAVTRAAAFVSSLATGALVGAVIGAGAVLVRRTRVLTPEAVDDRRNHHESRIRVN